ncbi:hypothetical protein [Photobacterium kishitanii]|uniref:Uncharacterized protein n=1 Tax=Photobacterium kishitanii TaxID=318456 RepID=A0A2T3KLG9_9GAMM|nr:hypothetical protein [Photobacterium kishitanii]PSV00503.1 hypothetical protein C9J27_05045 [Photobacterium kishitanii]
MNLNAEQISQLKSVLATKKGVLKLNLGYVPLSLIKLFDNEEISTFHIGRDFPACFHTVLDILELELVETGCTLEAHLKMMSNNYVVRLKKESPCTFFELLDHCEIIESQEVARYRLKK